MRTPLLLLVLLSLVLTTGCTAPSLRITPRVGLVELSGDFAATDSGLINTGSSVEALGLDDDQSEFIPRADFEFGPFLWTVDFADLSYSGTGTTANELTIGGVTVAANGEADTELELALYRSTFTWDVVPTDMVDVGLGFGLGGAEVSATVTNRIPGDPQEGQTATTDQFVPLPYAAASASVALGDFGLEGLLGFFSIEVDDVEVSYLDLDVSGYWQFWDVAGAGARAVLGYRYVDVEAEYEDGADQVDADLTFAGPYLGVTFVL